MIVVRKRARPGWFGRGAAIILRHGGETLEGASLCEAVLDDADFSGSNLEGVRLRDASFFSPVGPDPIRPMQPAPRRLRRPALPPG